MKLSNLNIDLSWTLFLDRDGIINKKLPNDYVKSMEEFEFMDGAKEAIEGFGKVFNRILVVTNQQGIGKGIMTKDDLNLIHRYMQATLNEEDAKIDKIYYCPELASSNSMYRKPNTGMAEEARKDFPEIDFKKSVMVGDSLSDMQMGKRVGMFTVFISPEKKKIKEADFVFSSLNEFYQALSKVI